MYQCWFMCIRRQKRTVWFLRLLLSSRKDIWGIQNRKAVWMSAEIRAWMGLKTEGEQIMTKRVRIYREIAQPRSHFVKERLLLFAEHKARIKISSKTMILTVFPISLSFLYQMPWNILQSISTPTLQCIGWSEYLFLFWSLGKQNYVIAHCKPCSEVRTS
jgi:hypothetical protein